MAKLFLEAKDGIRFFGRCAIGETYYPLEGDKFIFREKLLRVVTIDPIKDHCTIIVRQINDIHNEPDLFNHWKI